MCIQIKGPVMPKYNLVLKSLDYGPMNDSERIFCLAIPKIDKLANLCTNFCSILQHFNIAHNISSIFINQIVLVIHVNIQSGLPLGHILYRVAKI